MYLSLSIHIYIYIYICIHIFTYIHIHICNILLYYRKGDDTVGNPHRTRISQFDLFELILLLKLDKRFPGERFEATVSQSKFPSPPLTKAAAGGRRAARAARAHARSGARPRAPPGYFGPPKRKQQ